MKNKKMFIILSIFGLSSALTHTTLVEDLEQGVATLQSKLDDDQEVKELLQTIAKEIQTYKIPEESTYISSEERNELIKKWQLNIEQLAAFQTLAKKLKESLSKNAREGIRKVNEILIKVNEIQAERKASNKSKYPVIIEQKYKDFFKKIRELEPAMDAFNKLMNAIKDTTMPQVNRYSRVNRYAFDAFVLAMANAFGFDTNLLMQI